LRSTKLNNMQNSTMEYASWQRPLYGFEISQNQAKTPLKSGFSDGLGGQFWLPLKAHTESPPPIVRQRSASVRYVRVSGGIMLL
ncbi:MAG: hypothetical protein IKM76_06165, partial [Prevotella sp.]|nr:hypothetical protein [Prevotella sp.]